MGEGIASGDLNKAALNGAMLGMYGSHGANTGSKVTGGIRSMSTTTFAVGGAAHALQANASHSAYTRGFATGH